MICVKTKAKTIHFNGQDYTCRIGRKGAIPAERGCEGDEKTPLGMYRLRFGLYRNDRLPRPLSSLNFWPLRQDDGWCDAPDDPAYNRFIRLPYKASHETLWRDDGAYDIILVMDHNDSPPKSRLGSAVFIHIAQPDDRQTLGCIALEPEVMIKLLSHIQAGTEISIM